MGKAIDLFVTYRFLKLLATPFKKTDAFKLGIIDEKGHRILKPKSSKPAVELTTTEQKNAYTYIIEKKIFPHTIPLKNNFTFKLLKTLHNQKKFIK